MVATRGPADDEIFWRFFRTATATLRWVVGTRRLVSGGTSFRYFLVKICAPKCASKCLLADGQVKRFLPDIEVVVEKECALKVLGKLDEASGTGPDRIATRLLKRCRAELATGIHELLPHRAARHLAGFVARTLDTPNPQT